MFLVQLFLKINAGAWKKQTNHQKIIAVLHRGNAKCDSQEAFARGTIDDTIDEKQLISNRPPSRSAEKNKKGCPLEQIFSAAFSSLLFLSLQISERAPTDIVNKRAQESDRAIVGHPSPSSLSRSTFSKCPQKLTQNFFMDFSLETCPWTHHEESRSYSSGPNKSDRPGYRDGTLIQLKTCVLPRTTLKLTNLPFPSVSIIYCCFAASNLSLSQRLSRTVLAMSTRTCPEVRISWTFFVFFSHQRLKSMRALDEKHK